MVLCCRSIGAVCVQLASMETLIGGRSRHRPDGARLIAGSLKPRTSMLAISVIDDRMFFKGMMLILVR